MSIVDLERRRVTVTLPEAGFPVRFEAGRGALVTVTSNEVRRWSIPERKVVQLELFSLPEPTGADPADEAALLFGRMGIWHSSDRQRWHLAKILETSLSTAWIQLNVGRAHRAHVPAAVSPDGGLFALAASPDAPSIPKTALSSDGNSSFGGETLEIWDLRSKKRRHQILSGHTRDIVRLCFSPDGKLLASMSFDSVTRLWDVTTGALIHTLRGHKRGTFGGSFSPDGRTLVTANNDDTLKLWHVETGREVASFTPPFLVRDAIFSPDGRFLVALGQGVMVLRAPSFAEVADLAAERKEAQTP